MQITINGKTKEVEAVTLDSLVTELQIDVSHMAIERNEHIIPSSQYGAVRLEQGDKIELVEFVGGG